MSPSEAEPTTRARQREQTREQILAAAITVFARAGFEAASLADIGRSARVKKTLVQYHFATKEQLWKEAAKRLWSQRNQHLGNVLAEQEGDLSQRMRAGFIRLAEFTREHPQWLWFMFHEAAANDERSQWLIDNFLREDYRLGLEFVQLFQAEGVIRAGAPLQLLHLISGALTYNMLVAPQTRKVTGEDLASHTSIEQQVDLLQAMLGPAAA